MVKIHPPGTLSIKNVSKNNQDISPEDEKCKPFTYHVILQQPEDFNMKYCIYSKGHRLDWDIQEDIKFHVPGQSTVKCVSVISLHEGLEFLSVAFLLLSMTFSLISRDLINSREM